MLKVGDIVSHKQIPGSKGVLENIQEYEGQLEGYVVWEQGSRTWLPLDDHTLWENELNLSNCFIK